MEIFLGGRVLLEKLTPESDSSGRFQTQDDRGRVALFSPRQPANHLEYVEFSERGVTRGFHYHEDLTEVIYTCWGNLTIALRLVDEGEQVELNLGQGDLLTIGPGIAHAVLAQETSTIIATFSGTQSPLVDRVRYLDLSFSAEV